MRALSSDWLDDLEKSEDVFWSQETNLLRPVMPWLTPPVYLVLKRFIERNGVRKHFSAGELLIDPTEPVTSISVVERGITLRGAGAGGVDSPAAAYSTPGRLACGNLNFFSQQACAGTYSAATDATVVFCSQKVMREACRQDSALLSIIAKQFEMCALSDRLGFIAHKFLSVEERLACFLLSWCTYYGNKHIGVDRDFWIESPAPLRGESLRAVLGCSVSAFQRVMRAFYANPMVRLVDDTLYLNLSFLKPVHEWLCIASEGSQRYREFGFCFNDLHLE